MSTLGPDYRYRATLSRVIDGDTLELIVDMGLRIYERGPFRLAHLDCPEMDTPEGRAAKEFTADWCTKHRNLLVATEKNPEKYGRWLAVVVDTDTHEVLNEVLVQRGFARPYEGDGR